MFQKGMIIPIKTLQEWREVLSKIEKETDYLCRGMEGNPTNLSNSDFYRYEDDCAILIGTNEGRRVIRYGFLEAVKKFQEHDGYIVIPVDGIRQVIRRF